MMSWTTTLQNEYPKAVSFPALLEKTNAYLDKFGMSPENTLFADAACRDEVNRKSMELFSNHWGEQFELSGLGGYPCAGKTGLTAYSHHVPENGSLFILFGPHIGISGEGSLGKVDRAGRPAPGAACGALYSFLGKIQENADYTPGFDALDAEQYMLETRLEPHSSSFLAADNAIKTMVETMTDDSHNLLQELLEAIGYDQQVVLLGGIMINTPLAEDDYFAPRFATVLNKGHEKGSTENWLTDCF